MDGFQNSKVDGWGGELLWAAAVQRVAIMIELLIFWGGRLLAYELYRTWGGAVRRQMDLELLGYHVQQRFLSRHTAARAA